MLYLSRQDKAIRHLVFKEIVNLLDERHLLVLNNTKVFPARLFGRGERGGKIEVLLVKERAPQVWEVLAKPGRKLEKNKVISFNHGQFEAVVLEDKLGAAKLLKFNSSRPLVELLNQYGQTPLPPYMKRPHPEADEDSDRRGYQTVYARYPGSCACPTAGLHFTDELLDTLRKKSVGLVEITLHIGPGTFRPIKESALEKHHMDEEYYFISKEAASLINSERKKGRIIIGVGTSTVRALEEAGKSGKICAGEGWARLFIYPEYSFKIIQGLITNFHQSGSTPLALVAALAGEDLILRAYKEAMEKGYRFLSFGDSMLVL